MPQNYTKMWDAFLGGEWTGGGEAEEGKYMEQTEQFYQNIIGPAFGLDSDFGSTHLAGAYAQFSNVDLERAEREFRSAIGDPYGGGAGDPFSWEKVSRYNTEDSAGVGRLQDLLEDQLYGQGKFLGGEAGADYGTATSKELETYTTGMTGEREELTYGSLTSGASLASGTSGATIRSGTSMGVAEDVLIEAYKKAKTLGSDYRAGSELIEQTLEGDLNDALTTYLAAVDEEKEDWFGDVMRNVHTFSSLEMGEADTALALTDAELEAKMDEMDLEGIGSDSYENWSCGYGQTWDATLNNGEGGCKDTTGEGGYEEEVASYKFRDDPACGIGELWKDNGDGTGQCEVRDDTGLEKDDYGYLCEEGQIDECGECNGGNLSCTDECGVVNGDNSSCTDECDVVNGDNLSCADECGVPNGDNSTCTDECDVVNGPGAQVLCEDGSMVCDTADCIEEPTDDEKISCRMSGPNTCPDGMRCDDGQCVEAQGEDDFLAEPCLWGVCPDGSCKPKHDDCPEYGQFVWTEPEVLCRIRCPEGQELNVEECVCYDIWGGNGWS